MGVEKLKAPKGMGAECRGATLVEVVVVVGILVMAMGMVGSTVFQVLTIEQRWRDGAVATKELRHAGSWFAGDALNAESTDLVDGGPPVAGATLTWADSSGQAHSATYTLSGADLNRNYDGAQHTIARKVASAGFSLTSGTLTFDLEVQAGRNATKSASIQTFLRRLES